MNAIGDKVMERFDRRGQERGQALPLFVLMLIALLAATGLVVDVGSAWAQERSQQKVSDVAAIAGATKEANGGTRAEIIAAAIASAQTNGYPATDVQVNIPPTSGKFAPGAGKDAMLANDCSTAAARPCWVEVIITKSHSNFFAGVIGQGSWDVGARGVAVGGIANTVSNGLMPVMFNEDAVANQSPKLFCNPQDHKCIPNSDFPVDASQFNWTTVCVTGSTNGCNVNTQDTVSIINGDGFTASAWLGMDLGAHNQGQHTAACDALMDEYPDGGTFPVVINDDNGNLRGFWMWTFDPTTTECQGQDGMQLGGHFTADSYGAYPLSETPLTITSGVPASTFGLYVVKLVE
jgi:putative Flp pilus-assembly TadE/G-like protein